MDFGKILERWERERGNKDLPEKRDYPDDYLKTEKPLSLSKKALKKLEPEESIDLHGLSAAEAGIELQRFIGECRRKGVRKILIIHGKGLHSRENPVLPKTVRKILEQSPIIGDFGPAEPRLGGRGATWALIRK